MTEVTVLLYSSAVYYMIQEVLLSALLIVINGYVFSFGYLSVFQTYCSSQLIIIHSNLFEVDILGLADLAGDIFIIRGKGT